MVQTSAAPDVLHELFEALDNDPRLIAEGLVRPLLARRLAHQAYFDDARLHSKTAATAQRAAQRIHSLADMQRAEGEYIELVMMQWEDGVVQGRPKGDGAPSTILLDPDEWAALEARLDSGIFGSGVGMIGPLREERERFVVSAILDRSPHRVRIASVSWAKRSFDDWWSETRATFEPVIPDPELDLTLSTKAVTDISPDHWAATGTTGSPPSARTRHTAVWTGSEMIIWGGTSGEAVFYSGAEYDPATNSWSAMSMTNHPDARADHTAVWDGSRMIVWGGWKGTLINSGGRYTPGGSWSATDTSEAPTARRYHSAVVDSTGDMIVWGGTDGSSYFGGAPAIYDADTNDWSTGSSTSAPSARSHHTAAYVSGSNTMVVWGGLNASGVLGSGATYNPTANLWTAMATDGAPSARLGHSATAFPASQTWDRGVLIWGGFNGTNTLTSGGFYRPQGNSWQSTNTSMAPAGRQGHTTVSTELTAIVWGGFSGSSLRNTGGVYNPYNNVWMATSTTGAPTARKEHTAVWREINLATSNGEMIVWGGDDGSPASTGSRYSEPTDFLIMASYPARTVVPGGSEVDLFRTFVYSLGDFSSPVTLSCSMAALGCSFETNPATPSANSSTYPDVSVSPWSSLTVGEYSFTIDGTSGGTTRSYPFTVNVRDFDLSCSPNPVNVSPGAQAQVSCSVSSEYGFSDPVDMACTSVTCSFSTDPVTPPADGSATTVMTFTAPGTPGSLIEEVAAYSHGAYRVFELTVNTTDNPIFEDGFESGSTTQWSTTIGDSGA